MFLPETVHRQLSHPQLEAGINRAFPFPPTLAEASRIQGGRRWESSCFLQRRSHFVVFCLKEDVGFHSLGGQHKPTAWVSSEHEVRKHARCRSHRGHQRAARGAGQGQPRSLFPVSVPIFNSRITVRQPRQGICSSPLPSSPAVALRERGGMAVWSPATHLSHWVLAATLGGCVHFVGKQSKTQRAGQLPWARTAESGGARTVTRLTAAWALPWPGARSPVVWPSLLAAVGE